MSAREAYRFQQFLLRPAGAIETDALLARQWAEADPDHRQIDPSFWLAQGPDQDSYLLYDPEGALFFFKVILKAVCDPAAELHIGTAAELHIQFPPHPKDHGQCLQMRRRIREGLSYGLPWLEAMLRAVNVELIYFDSVNQSLIGFAVTHLGFARVGDRLRKRLTAPVGSDNAPRKGNRSDVWLN